MLYASTARIASFNSCVLSTWVSCHPIWEMCEPRMGSLTEVTSKQASITEGWLISTMDVPKITAS